MSGCGAGPGGPPTSWCPPFSGANAAEAQHHNPTRPRSLRIFPLFFFSFSLSIHPPLPPCSFLPSASFFLFHPLSPFPPCFILPSFPSFLSFSFLPSSYLTSFALHRFTSPCNIIICRPLSAVTLFSVGAARVPAPETNQTLPAIHETQALHLLQKPYVRRGDNRREESLWRAPHSGEL